MIFLTDNIGRIVLRPRYGSELGGTPIIVTGDKLSTGEDDNVTCVFDGVESDGFVTKDGQVLCVSPELSRTGRVPFRLQINQVDTSFIAVAIFISCEILNRYYTESNSAGFSNYIIYARFFFLFSAP